MIECSSIHLSSPIQSLPISIKCQVYVEIAVSGGQTPQVTKEFTLNLNRRMKEFYNNPGATLSSKGKTSFLGISETQEKSKCLSVTLLSSLFLLSVVCPPAKQPAVDDNGWPPRTNSCSSSGIWRCWYFDLVNGETLAGRRKTAYGHGESISRHTRRMLPWRGRVPHRSSATAFMRFSEQILLGDDFVKYFIYSINY